MTYTTSGIVLARTAHRDTDARIVIYTNDRGRLELIARGAKKTASRLAAHLEPCTLTRVMVVEGRICGYIGNAVSERAFRPIKGSLGKLEAAAAVLRSLNALTQGNSDDKRVFELVFEALSLIESCNPGVGKERSIAAFFILNLLGLLGYAPALDRCAVCRARDGQSFRAVSPDIGGAVCGRCDPPPRSIGASPEAIKTAKFAIGRGLAECSRIAVPEKLSRELEVVAEGLAAWHA